ncbi:MAG: hypothetical protein ACOH1T_05890 [Microbacteriaceae bacterium]
MKRGAVKNGSVRALAIAVLAAACVVSTELPASAAGDFPIAFDQPTNKTVEYGEQWFFEASGELNFDCFCSSKFVLIDGTTNKALASQKERIYPNDLLFTASVYSLAYDLGFLDAGDYSFKLRIEQQASQKATTDAPAKLTIAPAKLATQLRVDADPSSPSNVIVTVLATGRFVKEIDYSRSGYSPMMPAGTWTVTAKDSNGDVAFSEDFTQEEGTQSSFSAYWAGAPAATTYTFDGDFTPDAAVAGNFSVEPAAAVSLSTPVADAVVVPGDGEKPTAPIAVVSADPSLPIWAIVTLIILIITLAVATAVLAIRMRRARSVTS